MRLKDLVRAAIPQSLREARYQRRLSRDFETLKAEWQALRLKLSVELMPKGLDRVLIFPGDPSELIGSLGDEAMITASVQNTLAINPRAEIFILVDGEPAAAIARERGLVPIDIWRSDDFLHRLAQFLRSERIDALLANGADVIDGAYGIVVPGRMICAADIAVRLGARATILGSSFNTTPRSELADLFDGAGPRVAFLLRDTASLERFASFTSAMPELVADCAFMMAPSWPDPIVSRWIEERRKRSDKILGFNLHPMLVKEDPASVAGLVASAAEALEPILARGDTAIVLMPHDRRVGVGDSSMLEAIYHRMVSRHSEALLLLDPATLSAAQLKSIAGSLDGVVTGRMHLAIGALGMGVPVLCVGYQDKFEGLFAHFGMPEAMLMDAAAAGDPAVLNRRLSAFIDRLPELRVMVGDALPAVLARSRRNFAGLEAICN